MRVLLADDHPVVRAGVRNVLERIEGIELVGEAADGQSVMRAVDALRPDVVLIDINMPELNGIDATRALRRQHPETRVIIFSIRCDAEAVLGALEAGARAYVLKEAGQDELRAAILAVARGDGYFSAAAAKFVANGVFERTRERPLLSARERQVVQLISAGAPARDIAARLFVSLSTVKAHRANAMRKLGARTTADLVRCALRAGLTSL